MREHPEAEQHDRESQWGVQDEQQRRHEKCAEAEGDFARTIDTYILTNEVTAHPTSGQTAQTGAGEWNPRQITDFFDVQLAYIAKIFWQPKAKEVPDGVGEEFCAHQTEDLRIAEELMPGNG